MLKAKYKDTGQVLDITKIDNPRSVIDRERVVCRLCNLPVGVRHGFLRAKHFYHLTLCTSDYKRHPESPEHNFGKELISEHLKYNWSEYSDAQIELEYIIPDIRRVADIAMIFPSGWIVVHEIQLSSITNEELQERTNDYESIGIDTIWWLGKNADTKRNQEWCIKRFGYSLSIDYEILQSNLKNLQKEESLRRIR